MQSNKFELVINNQTVTMLNLTIPPSLFRYRRRGDRMRRGTMLF